MSTPVTTAPTGWVTVSSALGIAVIAGDRVDVLRRALADAIAYRKDRAAGYCAGCAEEFGGSCHDHAGDEADADDYATLARELGDGAG